MILFVCSGNICRSPMAEAIARLHRPGGAFASAGTWARRGDPATPEAVAAGAEIGADLAGHRSQPLSPALLAEAERVFVMTEEHLRDVAALLPAAAGRAELLDPAGVPVADPYGQSLGDYRRCCDQIAAAVAVRLGEEPLTR